MTTGTILLKELASFTMGQAPSGSSLNNSGEGVPFYRSGEFGEIRPVTRVWTNTPLREATESDVLVCVVGAYAGDINLGVSGAIGRSVAAISPGPSLDQHFLYYFLKSQELILRSGSQGSVQSVISKNDLAQIEIPAISLTEQKAISAVLKSLDDKIESNYRVVDKALALSRAFVDSAIAQKQLVQFESALNVVMGAAFKGEFFTSPGVGRPLLRIRDLKTFKSQTWTTEKRKDEQVISPGQIVVGMDAEFKATLWLGEASLLNQRVCSFSGKNNVGRAFVLAVLEPLLAFQEQAKTGTTVIHLNKSDIETFEVPNLTAAEHKQLSAITEPLIDLVVARSVEIQTLKNIRDSLLVDLLTRKISVNPSDKLPNMQGSL